MTCYDEMVIIYCGGRKGLIPSIEGILAEYIPVIIVDGSRMGLTKNTGSAIFGSYSTDIDCIVQLCKALRTCAYCVQRMQHACGKPPGRETGYVVDPDTLIAAAP